MLILLIKVLLYWLVGIIAGLIIHELGHVLAGVFSGWELFMFEVGPFCLERKERGGQLKLRLEKNILYWFGISGVYPKQASENNLKVWGRVLISGPVASIIFGFVLFTAFLFSKSLLLLMISVTSLALGIVNIIPLPVKTGFFYNDGRRFKRVKGSGQEAAEEQAVFKIVEHQMTEGDDVRLEESLLKPLFDSEDKDFRYYGYYILYSEAKKNKDDEKMTFAREKMEQLKEQVSNYSLENFKLE